MTSYQKKLVISSVPRNFFYQNFRKFYFWDGSLLYSFWRKSQLIKYSKWRTEIFKICIFELNFSILLRFQNKVYFCNQHDRLIPKTYIFMCLSVHFRFEKFYFRFTLKRQYL